MYQVPEKQVLAVLQFSISRLAITVRSVKMRYMSKSVKHFLYVEICIIYKNIYKEATH